MIRFVNAAIPLFFGIILIAFPQAFTKAPLDSEIGRANRERFRKIGYVLMAIGVGYVFIEALSGKPN